MIKSLAAAQNVAKKEGRKKRSSLTEFSPDFSTFPLNGQEASMKQAGNVWRGGFEFFPRFSVLALPNIQGGTSHKSEFVLVQATAM